jgi:pimeloyl-ACP methyl ester carboxylesterase/DNA-binding winged helix-turn-helix (wHTH) protein
MTSGGSPDRQVGSGRGRGAMIYSFGHGELDTDRYELRVDGELVPLEPQVFDVLAYLVERRDRVVTKEELLDNVWGDRFVSESALTSRIKAARRAVGDDGRAQRMIRTAHGRGYRFVGEITPGASAPTGTTSASPAEPTGAVVRAPRTRYAHSRGHVVAYQVVGEGSPTIVFIPGFVSNIELQWELEPFATFFRALTGLGRLIVFDKYGTGLSDRLAVSEAPTLEERMDDVRAVLDEVDCRRATLFGISEGGPMALMFAATYPERVDRLVLCGTYANEPFGSFERGEELADRAERFWGSGTVFESLNPSTVGDREQRRRYARYEINSATSRGAAALIRLTNVMDARSTLPAVSAPTLVVHRTGDTIVPVERGRELASAIPGSRLVEFPGRDHLAFVGDVDLMVDEVRAFLRGATSRVALPERHLATVLLVDPGSPAPSDARHVHHRLVSEAAGQIVESVGGLLAATFDGPARAVRVAQAVVEALGSGSRAGLHTAEVLIAGGSIAGVGVDIACSVAEMAEPGEVWVSRTVRDLVPGSGLGFADRGTHPLAGLDEPWPLFAAD